jgi:response regulator RpfG family c-di-GMP phosphodiesterase
VRPYRDWNTKSCEEWRRVDEMDNIQKLTYNHDKFATKKKTIMICDDEPDVLLSFKQILVSKYDIIMVDSGEECIGMYIEEINRGVAIIFVH